MPHDRPACEHREVEYVKAQPHRTFDYRCRACDCRGTASHDAYCIDRMALRLSPLDIFPVYVLKDITHPCEATRP